MATLNIKAKWDNEKTAWIASCDLLEELSIEAGMIEELIDIIKPLIPQITLTNRSYLSGTPNTIVLTKYWPVSRCIAIQS